ncbi:NAD(P)-binding protein [Cyathus striatus]|nr:NAD(P)-binding protein [Cyathus striatus]
MSYPSVAREYRFTKLEKKVEKPRASEVLVKVHAVSLQYRDYAISNRSYPVAYSRTGLIPCSDMAGEIVAVGEEVKDWKVGDRTCLGGQSPGVLTEYRSFPAHSLVHVPGHLSYEEASTLPCAALTAYNALIGLKPLKAGDYVLVQGTGGVSIFALQFAVASGAIVIATSSSDEKLKIAAKLGAKHLINYKKLLTGTKKLRKLGVDFVVEVGGEGTMPRSINAVRVGGSVAIIGFVSKDQGGTDFIIQTISKAIILRGVYIGSVDQFRDMNRMIVANPDVTRPVIDKVFSFEEATKAYAHLESQKHVGKVVIKVSA